MRYTNFKLGQILIIKSFYFYSILKLKILLIRFDANRDFIA